MMPSVVSIYLAYNYLQVVRLSINKNISHTYTVRINDLFSFRLKSNLMRINLAQKTMIIVH